MIRYTQKIDSCQILGPGNRAVLWVHGCCFDCPGCIASSYKHGNYKEATSQQLAQWVLESQAEGLTISGGEPMLQAKELCQMVKAIKSVKDISIIVYSGFTFSELQEREDALEFLHQIDVLIDGRYVQDLDHNEAYRGSSNQNVLCFNPAYEKEVEAYYHHSIGRKIELKIQGDQAILVGVPSQQQAILWKSMKEK